MSSSIAVTPAHLDRRRMIRLFLLLLSILISGGLMIFPQGPILLLIIFLCFYLNGMNLPPRRFMWPLFVLLAMLVLVTLVRPGEFSILSLVSRFGNYFAAVLLLQVYMNTSDGTLARDLQTLLFPMAIQALATVVLAHTIGILFLPISIGEQNYLTFLGLFNYHITIEGLSGLIRPDGFFYEPGVFQIYLNLFLYLTLFVFRNPKQALVAALAVLSTQSTTGILISMILLAAGFMQHVTKGSLRRKVVVVLMGLLLAPPLANLAYGNIRDKLFGAAQGSSWSREYDLYTGLRIAAENPWMGIGFETKRYLEASGRLGFEDTLLDPTKLLDRTSSNGLVQLLYSLGIPLALPFLYGILKQKLFRHRFLIATWLVFSMLGEALVVTPFIMLIIFSAFLIEPAVDKGAKPLTQKGVRA